MLWRGNVGHRHRQVSYKALGDGAILMHNSETESELRSLTIGGQNWLFVDSNRSGEVAAAMYSLVSSASRHKLDV